MSWIQNRKQHIPNRVACTNKHIAGWGIQNTQWFNLFILEPRHNKLISKNDAPALEYAHGPQV